MRSSDWSSDVCSSDLLEEPGNWIALIELFRNAAHFGDDDRRKIDLGFFVEPGLAPVALARDRAGCIDEAPGDSAVFVDEGDRKSTRLNSSHYCAYRMPYSAGKKKITRLDRSRKRARGE